VLESNYAWSCTGGLEEKVASAGLAMTSGCSWTEKNFQEVQPSFYAASYCQVCAGRVLINPSEESIEQGFLRQDCRKWLVHTRWIKWWKAVWPSGFFWVLLYRRVPFLQRKRTGQWKCGCL